MGVGQCTVNGRNDVIIKDGDKELKMSLVPVPNQIILDWSRLMDTHVSGSAYKIIQHRAYHHGTMLISSSLDQLGRALKSSSVSYMPPFVAHSTAA